MIPKTQPDRRLSKLLILLSLDGVVPLYEEIGVPVENRQAFLRVLRETILENRRIWESGAEQTPALKALLLKNLRARLGPEAAGNFSRWASTVFLGDHAEQPQWSAWDIVLSHWAFNAGAGPSGLPEDEKRALLDLYVEKTSVEDLKAKVAELKSRKLSEWDLDMYARHGYGVDEYADPYLVAELMVKMRRLREFWDEAGPGLSDEEKEVLLKEGRALVERLGVWMPDSLRSPDELREE